MSVCLDQLRMCVIVLWVSLADSNKFKIAFVIFTEEDFEELMAEERRCGYISYFGQGYERVDSGATSESILRMYFNKCSL